MSIKFPHTIYAISIAYLMDDKIYSHAAMFVLSGLNILTAEEICNRGYKQFAKDYEENHKKQPPKPQTLCAINFNYAEVRE